MRFLVFILPAIYQPTDGLLTELEASQEDFARMMIFSGLDSEVDWEEFSQFAQACLDSLASGSAWDGLTGSRLEDQAPHRHLSLVH